MTIPQTIIKYIAPSTQRHVLFTPARNFLCGAGLAYTVSNEKYAHIPLIVVAPSVYAGYQAYIHRDAVRAWLREGSK